MIAGVDLCTDWLPDASFSTVRSAVAASAGGVVVQLLTISADAVRLMRDGHIS